ncbi:hypothetical protein M1D46_13835 [Microbacterium sp. JZ70]
MGNPTWRALLAPVAALAAAALLLPSTATAAEEAPPRVDLVDAQATDETRSLFAYLRDIGGTGILFGHQHTTDYGETFTTRDGTASDVLAATGDHPAVFGFDTLIIEGRERPGDASATREENALTLARSIREAHDLGGISTLSGHVENVVTGGDFYDTTGDALRAVLPGGTHHDELRAHLDLVALAAQNAVDAEGAAIPIVYRPWHENAGSWFWWGAAFGSPGEYAELFRFTVEYLRDIKGVHNLLYAFSPGGGFGGSAEQYLRTYPGDDFVDVLGYDTYDPSASQTFLDGLVADLGMIGRLGAERGKVTAFTEFGITGGVKPDGENANPTWYTDVLDAIRSDADASRLSYMLTWANFGGDTAPYTPVEGEMLADFSAFHDDPRTLFADDVTGAFDRATDAAPAAPVAHIASPADGARVAEGPVALRASITGTAPIRAWIELDDGSAIDLAPPTDGGLWWTGNWDIPADQLDNSTRALILHVKTDGAEDLSATSHVVVGPRPELPLGVVDDFEGYGDDTALRSEYVQYQANEISLETASTGGGEKALRLDYSFANQSYTGTGRQLSGDWSSFWDFQAWIDPDASGNRLVLQLVADGVAFEAYPSLAGDDPYLATIPFADWRPAPWDTANADRRLTPEALAKVSQFNVYVNAADGGAVEGSIVVDELRAVEGTPPPTVYADVPRDHAAYVAIQWLHDEVVDLGDANGRFHPSRAASADDIETVLKAYAPDAGVTADGARRLDLAVALWRAAGEPAPAVPRAFDDVPDAHAAAAAWAVEYGIIAAHGPDRLKASARVDRAELATAVHALDAVRDATGEEVLFAFAEGADGWAIASWQTEGSAAAADGRLIVDAAAGGNWVSWTGSLDLAGRSALLVDVAASTGFDGKAALQLGSDWTWCETANAGWAEGERTGEDAVVIDLTTLDASCREKLGDVRGVNLHLDEGHHEIEEIRAR